MTKRATPYGSSNHLISKKEWDVLDDLFIQIERPAQSELYASGDHYTLNLLLIKLGFRPLADALEVYEMAEEILLLGWAGMEVTDDKSDTATAE